MNFELIDITNEIIPEDECKFFNDDEALEIYQICIYLMEEFIKQNPKLITEPDFADIFDENIEKLMHSQFESDIFYTEEAEDEMEEIIEHAKTDFFNDYIPPRSYPDTLILENPDYDYIKEQLNVLRNKPQPTQRTKEWYEFRHNLITASNAYKAFESQSTQNQLIYEKCKSLNDNICSDDFDLKTVVMVNINTPFHWGHKYEPLSVLYYEYTYETKIEDFGCIQQYPH